MRQPLSADHPCYHRVLLLLLALLLVSRVLLAGLVGLSGDEGAGDARRTAVVFLAAGVVAGGAQRWEGLLERRRPALRRTVLGGLALALAVSVYLQLEAVRPMRWFPTPRGLSPSCASVVN